MQPLEDETVKEVLEKLDEDVFQWTTVVRPSWAPEGLLDNDQKPENVLRISFKTGE